jgi:8-oxo-dGTP diphosphatase
MSVIKPGSIINHDSDEEAAPQTSSKEVKPQMQYKPNFAKLGVGVIVVLNDKVLLGKRINCHGADTWAPPGGYVHEREDPLDTAVRKLHQETGIKLYRSDFSRPVLLAAKSDTTVNNAIFFIAYLSDTFHYKIVNGIPDKCESWEWFYPASLPSPLFETLAEFVKHHDLKAIVDF